MTVSKTVIISCAGMGKRLGLGTSKCLVDVAGESLIMRNLKMLGCSSEDWQAFTAAVAEAISAKN